jgi:hypothetical protein
VSDAAKTLRKIAADVRTVAENAEQARREKAAHVVRAAVGLQVLRDQMKVTK